MKNHFQDGENYFQDGKKYFQDAENYFQDGKKYFQDGKKYFQDVGNQIMRSIILVSFVYLIFLNPNLTD